MSTGDQTLALQRDALQATGRDRVFTDTISGAKADRPGLSQALDHLREGDTLVVWRLDRLGRSLGNLIELQTQLDDQHIGFRSLTGQMDTTTSGGKLIFQIFGALAEFERNLIREPTRAGLAAARARGPQGGRLRLLDLAKQIATAQASTRTKAIRSRRPAKRSGSREPRSTDLSRPVQPYRRLTMVETPRSTACRQRSSRSSSSSSRW